jgi:hypothetical protein
VHFMELESSVTLLTRAGPSGLVCSVQALNLSPAAGSLSIAYEYKDER